MVTPIGRRREEDFELRLQHVKKFVGGGISCMAAACVTNPVDVIKTRLQIQGELGGKVGGGSGGGSSVALGEKHYQGFTRGILRILQEEKLRGLYKGLTASMMREGTYSTLRMGGYEIFRDLLFSNTVDSSGTRSKAPVSLWQKIVAGMLSGALGAAIANPTDLVKVRLQAEGKLPPGVPKRYSGTLDAFSKIYHQEGIRGLYKGVGPTTQRAALLTASQLASYDHFKHLLLRHTGMKEGMPTHFCSSIFAGLVAALVTSPIDTVKTRIMNQAVDSQGRGLRYSSTLDCFLKTMRAEGPLGLYKGFIPNWLRIGPHTIVTFIVFEQYRKWTGLPPV